MNLYYRISDNSYKKPKLIGATKENCLNNFIKVFNEVIFKDKNCVSSMKIIADNCEQKTLEMVRNTGIPVKCTNYGNAGSLRHAIELAIEECKEEEVVYFVEDDYLHLDKSPKIIEEGINRSDYVTLYDHPDKYNSEYNGGEYSKVIKTDSTHWRYTISTCMTFASRVKTLKEDFEFWKKFTEGPHPHDHYVFSQLNKEKRRRLAVCIPGVACHCDLEYSNRKNKFLIESWAVDLLCEELISGIDINNNILKTLNSKKKLDKLMLIDAIIQSKNNI
jgi:hypothetical protein